LSNLLKKSLDPDIASFGFPVIQMDSDPSLGLLHLEEQPTADEISSEELYRRKLLEIERRTQEIEREAYNQGFAQGEKDGLDYGQKSLQVIVAQIERTLRNMQALPAKILQDYRDWLIRKSIAIARQIVNREIQTSPEIVADTVKALIEEVEEHPTLTVYLNPNDLELLEKRAGLTPEPDGKYFALKEDKDLDRGGCRIESAIQLLDASMGGLFENLEKRLLARGDAESAEGAEKSNNINSRGGAGDGEKEAGLSAESLPPESTPDQVHSGSKL
jgi:flagellar assembly protein FliH